MWKNKFIYLLVITAVLFLSSHTGASAVTARGIQVLKIHDKEGKEIGLYNESHALLISASDYRNGWPTLPGVKEDIKAVSEVLKEHGFSIEIIENPTHDQLKRAFDDFISRFGRDADSRLLFYFAGHGNTLKQAYGGEMGYIVPIDAPNPSADRDGFLDKAMDMQQIEVYAKRIQSKHALFLFDSCFSGSIFSLTRAVPKHITYKTAKPVRQFITSGSADEQVPDESIFRRQLILALRGDGDLNKDGYVTGDELGMFIEDQVTNYSKGTQHPQSGKIRDPNLDKGDFIFIMEKEDEPAIAAVEDDTLDVEAEKQRLQKEREKLKRELKQIEEIKEEHSKLETEKKRLKTEKEELKKITDGEDDAAANKTGPDSGNIAHAALILGIENAYSKTENTDISDANGIAGGMFKYFFGNFGIGFSLTRSIHAIEALDEELALTNASIDLMYKLKLKRYAPYLIFSLGTSNRLATIGEVEYTNDSSLVGLGLGVFTIPEKGSGFNIGAEVKSISISDKEEELYDNLFQLYLILGYVW